MPRLPRYSVASHVIGVRSSARLGGLWVARQTSAMFLFPQTPHCMAFFLSKNPAARVTLAHFIHPDIQASSERQRMRRHFETELREMLPEAFQDQIADTVVDFCRTAEGIVRICELFSHRSDHSGRPIRWGLCTCDYPWSFLHHP